jgi:methenyltetrahydromethanopterin cyclohydrolase
MTLSVNRRALRLVDRLVADSDLLRVGVSKLDSGARLIDCGSEVAGGWEAGRLYAEICMGGLGWVSFAPVAIDGLWLPALTVATDHPARACLASQYAGWRLQHEKWFAMASGPGRALVRAEDLYDDLDVDERSDVAVFCLEAREMPPEEVIEDVAKRAGVSPLALTLVVAPTASLVGSVQIAARVVETALHKLHELDFDVRRVVSGLGTCPVAPVSEDDLKAIGRTNDAVLYGGRVHLTVEAGDDELEGLAQRLPASASDDYGEPFGAALERVEYDFYKIDPLLFSPAQVMLTSTESGRSFSGGQVAVDVLKRSFGL